MQYMVEDLNCRHETDLMYLIWSLTIPLNGSSVHVVNQHQLHNILLIGPCKLVAGGCCLISIALTTKISKKVKTFCISINRGDTQVIIIIELQFYMHFFSVVFAP